MDPICEVRMQDYWIVTDAFGAANFTNFTVTYGPMGLYTFKFKTTNFQRINSDVFSIYFDSTVYTIESLNQYDFMK